MPQEKENSGRNQRFSWFSVVLYPYFDDSHKALFEHMQEYPTIYQHLCWIDHDRDLYVEDTETDGVFHKAGETKKSHRHVLFRHPRQSSVNGVVREFDGIVNVVEGIFSPEACLLYFLHQTFSAKRSGKVRYELEELQGDLPFVHKALAQNTNYIQLREIVEMVLQSKTGSLAELLVTIGNLSSEFQDLYYDSLKSNQSLICTLTNQQIKVMEARNENRHWQSGR